MARNFKHEVAAANLRIPSDYKRDYKALIKALVGLKRGVKVYGNTNIAINYYDEKQNIGILSKYDEVDPDADWFNTETFSTAMPDEILGTAIAANLKPNHHRFYFNLDEKLHVFVFSSYSKSTSLSVAGVEKYFRTALTWKEILSQFGPVDADIVKDHAGVRRLLELPEIREISITIRPPNADDVSGSLAAILEKRLHSQNADEYNETWKASGKQRLNLDSETKELGKLAADNGEVKVKNIENGLVVPYTSNDMPLKEADTFRDAAELSMFRVLAAKLLKKIGIAREGDKGMIHE